MSYLSPNKKLETVYYDEIISLPTDNSQPSPEEIEIMNAIFREHESTITKMMNELVEPLIAGLLFIFFSLDYTTNLVYSLLPCTIGSDIFLLLAKAGILMVLFWILKHLNLARKNF
jgi:uncharacterized membrane protein YeaQ/YmgE (transglycosylase-associated protein family)